MIKIALGVCSSVSIYKACEVIRGFQKRDVQVQVIMTSNAAKLVTPLLFSALTGLKTIVDTFEEVPSRSIGHVALSREVSLLLVAPASANTIGKFSSGIADDFLSTFFMAVKCPALIAPAMNEAMYTHHQVQMNMMKLKALGVEFIEPGRGYLACGEEGWGRLAAPEIIVEEAMKLILGRDRLKGVRFLITAGPTREYLDPVRFLSNPSSGKMGYELAGEALRRGADVILVSGPSQVPPPYGAKFIKVNTAAEMEKEVLKEFPSADVVIMAAAVSDFRFARSFSQKIRKGDIAGKAELVRTPDILERLGRNKKGKILVGFAAETRNMKARAVRKVREKNLDLIVANDVSREEIGFESDSNEVSLIDARGNILVDTGKMSKRDISRAVLDHIEVLLGKKS